MMESGYKG